MQRAMFFNVFCMDCKKQRVCKAYEIISELPVYIELKDCQEFDRIEEK